MSNETNNANKNNFFSKTKSMIQHATNNVHAANVSVNVNSLQDSLHSLTGGLLRPKFNLPDRAVASQVLMYRQLLHTECKPGLRLSREYQGTDAQKKVMHMPWWEQGVEKTKKMVISYDNLIVRLWLAGAIMPFVDGGYAEEHSNVSVLKDDCSSDIIIHDETDDSDDKSHIDTLIDSKGLPPIPHPYWVDRLGFQQTDPVTDFRSGGVLSLAMLCHIVEACPHVHARFLPSGDTHMLPFGITCINITDMIAKFCMFSKSVDKMDALLSQKPFWKMFENPDSLLILQELSMETLCNVVAELKRERKMECLDETTDQKNTMQHNRTGDVTVFDFSEILKRTEKRVNDDLLGSGPRTVDELRAIHNKNLARYLRAMEQREKAFEKKLLQKQQKEQQQTQSPPVKPTTVSSEGAFGKSMSESVHAIAEPVKSMTGNVIGTTTGMLNKFKDFGLKPLHGNGVGAKMNFQTKKPTMEEINFDDDDDIDFAKVSISECDPSSASTSVPTESALDEARDIFNGLDSDDLHSETERAKQQFANLLSDTDQNASAVDLFTIDDDDDDFLDFKS